MLRAHLHLARAQQLYAWQLWNHSLHLSGDSANAVTSKGVEMWTCSHMRHWHIQHHMVPDCAKGLLCRQKVHVE